MRGNDFDRRDLLKGLLAVPGAAAMGGLLTSCESVQPGTAKTATATTITFNLVLHGTYALQFDTQNKQVLILIPTVLDHGVEAHEYRAGLYLNEPLLKASPTTVQVFGFPLNANNLLPDVVTQSPRNSDPTKFAILRKRDLQPAGAPLRNKFQLPYPRSIGVLYAQEFKPGPTKHKFFEDPAGLIPKIPTQIPLCIRLQYDLSVDGTFPMSPPPSIHYHLFAEQRKKPGEPHITTAFAALTSMYQDQLGGLKVSQDVTGDIDKPPSLSVLQDAAIQTTDDVIPGEDFSLEKRDLMAICAGAGHVGSCASLILVSGPDA